MGTPWTDTDLAFLHQHYPTKGAQWCAAKLRRSLPSVESRAKRLGIQYHRYATIEPRICSVCGSVIPRNGRPRKRYRKLRTCGSTECRGAINRHSGSSKISEEELQRRESIAAELLGEYRGLPLTIQDIRDELDLGPDQAQRIVTRLRRRPDLRAWVGEGGRLQLAMFDPDASWQPRGSRDA